MNLFKRIRVALGAQTPRDGMIDSYPLTDFEEATGLQAYPPKVLLKHQAVFAYRLEFAAFEEDAARVVGALASTFDWPNRALFQDGQTRRGDKSAHFSIRSEFHGAVVVTVTNSAAFIQKIDALNIEPPRLGLLFPTSTRRLWALCKDRWNIGGIGCSRHFGARWTRVKGRATCRAFHRPMKNGSNSCQRAGSDARPRSSSPRAFEQRPARASPWDWPEQSATGWR